MDAILERIDNAGLRDDLLLLYGGLKPEQRDTLLKVIHHLTNLPGSLPSTSHANGSAAPKTKSETKSRSALYTFADLSFSSPLRKRVSLHFDASFIWIGTASDGVASSGTVTGVEALESLTSIRAVVVVPTPASMKESSTLVIAFEGSGESWSFSTLEDVPLQISGSQGSGLGMTSDVASTRLLKLLIPYLPSKGPFRHTEHPLVLRPESRIFHSAAPNVQAAARMKRKANQYDSDDEDAQPLTPPPLLYTQAHVNRKEGYLYFLPAGRVLFGFKKPILFFSPDRLSKVIFMSIVSRTFNLQMTLMPDGDDSTTASAESTLTFEMIDIADLPAIQTYVERHWHGRMETDSAVYKSYAIPRPSTQQQEVLLPKVNGLPGAPGTVLPLPPPSSDDDEDDADYDDSLDPTRNEEEVPEEYHEDYDSGADTGEEVDELDEMYD